MGETESVSFLELVLAGMLGMFVLAMGVVFFFITYQRRLFKQKQENQQLESDYQQELLRATIRSQEKERNRIGKDLHDEVGALLTTSGLYLSQMNSGISEEKFTQLKSKISTLLEETVSSVRSISHDLKPVLLENFGLLEAMTSVVDRLNQSNMITAILVHDVKGNIDKDQELDWYRILNELISNTLKHARASAIEINISGWSQSLKVEYKDDGIGFIDDKKKLYGLGLRNIESRLKLMNGTIEFKTGTTQGIHLLMTSSTQPQQEKDD